MSREHALKFLPLSSKKLTRDLRNGHLDRVCNGRQSRCMKRHLDPDVRTEAWPDAEHTRVRQIDREEPALVADQRRTGLRKPACGQGIEHPFTVGAALLAGFRTTCRGRHI